MRYYYNHIAYTTAVYNLDADKAPTKRERASFHFFLSRILGFEGSLLALSIGPASRRRSASSWRDYFPPMFANQPFGRLFVHEAQWNTAYAALLQPLYFSTEPPILVGNNRSDTQPTRWIVSTHGRMDRDAYSLEEVEGNCGLFSQPSNRISAMEFHRSKNPSKNQGWHHHPSNSQSRSFHECFSLFGQFLFMALY